MEKHIQEWSLSEPMDICEAIFLESNKQLELDISDDFSLFDSTQELKDDGKK